MSNSSYHRPHHVNVNKVADGITRVIKLGELAKKSGRKWVSLAACQQVYHNR